MKTLTKFGTALLIAIIFASCGSNKTTTTPVVQQQMPQQPVVTPQTPTVDPEIADMEKRIKLAELQRKYDSITMAKSLQDPCYCKDDPEYFREYGIAINLNKASAQSLSIDVAIENLKKHIGESVQGMSTSYRNLYSGSKPADDIQRKIEGRIVSTVDKFLLNHKSVICHEWHKDERGNYVYYCGVEASKQELKNELTEDLNKLSKDEKLDIDFREQRFQKVMDETFQKMHDEKKQSVY